jgi:hypothetical protein
MLPNYWVEFISNNALTGATAEVPPPRDQSGLGAEIAFLIEAQSTDEATNFWPGLAVAGDGYVPVGSCLSGSGDYYYIRTNDGVAGALYRVYHDAVSQHGYDSEEAIAVVLGSYEELLDYVDQG